MGSAGDDPVERARVHLGRSLAEALSAAQAVLEAAAGAPGHTGKPAVTLEEGAALILRLLGNARVGERLALPRSVSDPLDEALAAEIDRWERRSRTDPDARAVLRVFLGLRELVWQLSRGETTAAAPSPTARPTSSRPRVQRFEVESD